MEERGGGPLKLKLQEDEFVEWGEGVERVVLDMSSSEGWIDSTGTELKREFENFGKPHWQQYHETFVCWALYIIVFMCMHDV